VVRGCPPVDVAPGFVLGVLAGLLDDGVQGEVDLTVVASKLLLPVEVLVAAAELESTL